MFWVNWSAHVCVLSWNDIHIFSPAMKYLRDILNKYFLSNIIKRGRAKITEIASNSKTLPACLTTTMTTWKEVSCEREAFSLPDLNYWFFINKIIMEIDKKRRESRIEMFLKSNEKIARRRRRVRKEFPKENWELLRGNRGENCVCGWCEWEERGKLLFGQCPVASPSSSHTKWSEL